MDFQLLHNDIDDFDKNLTITNVPNLKKEVVYEASVLDVQHYGMICEIIDTPFYGLLHKTELPHDFQDNYKLGNVVKVKIKKFVSEHNKYNLTLAK